MEEIKRTVNDFADFDGLEASTAIANARAHIASKHGIDASATLPLVRFEYQYFYRPQCLEIEFDLGGQSSASAEVCLDPDGKVLTN